MSEKEYAKMQKIVRLTYIKIGIKCNERGFNYLCYGTELVIEDPELLHNLCKGLYVKIAEKYKTNVQNVERCIRDATDTTREQHSFGELNKVLGMLLFGIDEKPKAGELIGLVAEIYNMKLYKKFLKDIDLD